MEPTQGPEEVVAARGEPLGHILAIQKGLEIERQIRIERDGSRDADRKPGAVENESGA
jgi:hypothetical protein